MHETAYARGQGGLGKMPRAVNRHRENLPALPVGSPYGAMHHGIAAVHRAGHVAPDFKSPCTISTGRRASLAALPGLCTNARTCQPSPS